MDAFDADVLIRAAQGLPDAAPVRRRFYSVPEGQLVGTGSIQLLPEVLSHPLRHGNLDEYEELENYLARLRLAPVDTPTARLSMALRARYGLRTVDATHLATAIIMDASRFVTNNHRDFRGIREIEVVGPNEV